jgi:microcystin-dependent protein
MSSIKLYKGLPPNIPANNTIALYFKNDGVLYQLDSAGVERPVGTDYGDIKYTAKTTLSPGWLVCDGSAVSRTIYANLFTAIGTVYGSGDGSTTFNVPDYRGRTILGAGTGTGLTTRAMGQTGGEESHILTTPEMPAHSHTMGGDLSYAAGSNLAVHATTTGTLISTSSTGGGTAHNNMQPFGVANVWIYSGI